MFLILVKPNSIGVGPNTLCGVICRVLDINSGFLCILLAIKSFRADRSSPVYSEAIDTRVDGSPFLKCCMKKIFSGSVSKEKSPSTMVFISPS